MAGLWARLRGRRSPPPDASSVTDVFADAAIARVRAHLNPQKMVAAQKLAAQAAAGMLALIDGVLTAAGARMPILERNLLTALHLRVAAVNDATLRGKVEFIGGAKVPIIKLSTASGDVVLEVPSSNVTAKRAKRAKSSRRSRRPS